MHWITDGADAIIALRYRQASSAWEAICNTPAHSDTNRLTRPQNDLAHLKNRPTLSGNPARISRKMS